MAASRMQIKELAARMRPTGNVRHPISKQRLVAAIVVNTEMPLPLPQEAARVLAAPTRLILKDDDRGTRVQIIATIRS
jgi:hypothetical protein